MAKTAKVQEEAGKRIAVVRVRGSIHMKPQIKKTFELLKLEEPNHCVVIDSNPKYRGMLLKINDYVTWGEVIPAVMEKLMAVRGQIQGGRLTEEFMKTTQYGSIGGFVKEFMAFNAELSGIPGFKKTFRLNPPRGGFERLGIKKPYSIGGVLGYRGSTINKLIERML
jgi:large subunit ribosomal protein L30